MLTEKETHQFKIIMSLMRVGTHSTLHVLTPIQYKSSKETLVDYVANQAMRILPGSVFYRNVPKIVRENQTLVRFFTYDNLIAARGTESDILWLLGPVDAPFSKEDEDRVMSQNRGLNPLVFIGDSI